MKKQSALSTVFLLLAFFSFGQTQKGKAAIGIMANGAFAKGYQLYVLYPELYWFSINRLAVGIDLEYNFQKYNGQANSIDLNRGFGFFPGMKYYFRNDGKIFRPSLYLNYGESFLTSQTIGDPYGYIGKNQFSGNAGIMFSFYLNSNFSIDFKMDACTCRNRRMFYGGFNSIGIHVALEKPKPEPTKRK